MIALFRYLSRADMAEDMTQIVHDKHRGYSFGLHLGCDRSMLSFAGFARLFDQPAAVPRCRSHCLASGKSAEVIRQVFGNLNETSNFKKNSRSRRRVALFPYSGIPAGQSGDAKRP